jgi:hypothetical protein
MDWGRGADLPDISLAGAPRLRNPERNDGEESYSMNVREVKVEAAQLGGSAACIVCSVGGAYPPVLRQREQGHQKC